MHPVHPSRRYLARNCCAALAGVLGLVATPPAVAGEQESGAPPAAATADPGYSPPENWRELLAVDEPMRRFFSTRVDGRKDAAERLKQIVDAIVLPDGLNFAYAVDGNYHAPEAFRRRQGNCAAFAFLVAAMAREYGLVVQFQEFDTFQRWNRYDRFLADVRHTNVRMSTYDKVYTVDLRPDLPPQVVSDTRYIVGDEMAFAHFYSTAGFFRLVHGDTAGALRLMKLGAETDPRSKIVWANLGNVYLQGGELGLARNCFERSLRMDPRGELALVCLVEVLRRQGGAEELKLADKYEHHAQALRVRNPYYHYHLAEQARAGGDWPAAEQHLRRAIRLKGDEPAFREQLVVVLRQLGRADDVRREEARLARLRDELTAAAGRIVQ